MLLHVIGHNVKNRMIGLSFIQLGQIISYYFSPSPLCYWQHELIHLHAHRCAHISQGHLEISQIQSNLVLLEILSACIQNCIHRIVLECLMEHIHVSVPAEFAAFCGKKMYPTWNILVIDFDHVPNMSWQDRRV